MAHPLLHDAERPAGLVAVDQHKPEEVEHPVGRAVSRFRAKPIAGQTARWVGAAA